MDKNLILFLGISVLIAVSTIFVLNKLDRLIEAVNDLAYDDDDDSDDGDGDGDGDDDGEPLPNEDCACETVRFES